MRRLLVIGGLGLVVWFAVVAFASMWMFRLAAADRRPALAAVAPLPPIVTTSVVVHPATVSIAGLRAALENAAPQSLPGRREAPLAGVAAGQLTWTIERGPLSIAGRGDTLTVTAPLRGAIRASGQFAGQGAAQTFGNFDQRREVRGSVALALRPRLAPNWRIEPNATASVTIADDGLTIGPTRLNVAREVRQPVERLVAEQVGALEERVRQDGSFERTARRDWAALCRVLPLGASDRLGRTLWLEVRPTRALAAPARVEGGTLTLALGIEAETRIISSQVSPICPFAGQIEAVPSLPDGRVAIGVPLDMPLEDIARLIATRLAGQRFAANEVAALMVTHVELAASGDRLLLSLSVRSTDAGWFGLGGEATLHLWARPVLEGTGRVLRLADFAFDAETPAAMALLGPDARAAVPLLPDAVAEHSRIDLAPLLAAARPMVATAQDELKRSMQEATGSGLEIVGVAFDSTTLRAIAEARIDVRVAGSALPLP